MHVKMNVIAKICCYFESSVVTLKLWRIFKYSDIQYTSLTPDKIMNSLVYRTLFYVNIYGSYKLSKNSPVFWPTLYVLLFHITSVLVFTLVLVFLSTGHFCVSINCELWTSSTCSSSVVTLQPPIGSSLKITNQCVSRYLTNQLSDLLHLSYTSNH